MQGSRYLDKKLIDAIEKMEINFDNGDWQPINHVYQQLKALNAMWYPREVIQSQYLDLATTDEIDTGVGELSGFNLMSTSGVVDADQSALGHDPTWNFTEIIATAGMNAWLAKSSGIFPHQQIYIPFTEYSEDNDFGVDTTKWGRIDMKTTTGASVSTSQYLKTIAEFAVPNGE
jgi:hypothetical protein